MTDISPKASPRPIVPKVSACCPRQTANSRRLRSSRCRHLGSYPQLCATAFDAAIFPQPP